MARYTELSFVTSSVPAGSALTVSQLISSSHINLVKLKVVPGVIGGTTRFQVYKRATFIDADNLYDTRDFEGSLIDPVLDYSDPMTDTPGATAERNEGPPIPYEDADGTSKLHLRIFNGDINPKLYTVTIWYELPAVIMGGLLTVPALNVTGELDVGGNTILQSLWVNGALDIVAAVPTLTFTDTTASAKGMKIVVDGNKGYITEKAAAVGTLWTFDLVNLRVGFNITNPITRLANVGAGTTGSDGVGPSPDAITWFNTQAGWTMQVVADTSVANCKGLLVKGLGNSAEPVMQIESASYPKTLQVTSNGRVGIATAPAAILHINGDQRPTDWALRILRSVAGATICSFGNTSGDDTAVIVSSSTSSSSGPNISLYYSGTAAMNLITSTISTIIDMLPRDFGASQNGCYIWLGRNTNAGNPCAGYVNFINKNGTNGAVWQDAAGNLRIWTTHPASGDTGGVVIGTQTSIREGKEIVRPITPADRNTAIEHLLETPLYVYLLNNEVGAGFNHFHVGFIADEQPAWMMYDSNSIDVHRIGMELLIGYQDHEARLRALEEPAKQ